MKDVSAQQVLETLAEVSGVDDLTLEVKFAELEMDSLTLIEWVSMLEESIEADLDIRDLDTQALENLSIGDVVEVLRKRIVNV